MKCPHCGAENVILKGNCFKCGNALSPSKELIPGRPPVSRPTFYKEKPREQLDHRDIPKKMKLDYQHGFREQSGRSIEGIQTLLLHLQKPRIDIKELMSEAANLIYRQFGIANVAIGLRSQSDGLYRYETLVGFRDDAVAARRSIAYTKGEFYDEGVYKGTYISRYTKVYLAEDRPYEESERQAFNRPVLLESKRTSSADSLEGDYIDTNIYGVGDDLIGWIEISGTRTGKIPDIPTLRWIEVISSVIGAAILLQQARERTT